jgi:hypothetical protein
MKVDNPYWEEMKAARNHPDEDNWGFRWHYTHRFSWSVPSPRALKMIRDFSANGIVEIGAGTGYWASVLRQMGVDVVAYDRFPIGEKNKWHRYAEKMWSDVLRGFATSAAKHPDRTLMLCWPPTGSWRKRTSVSDQALGYFQGDQLIYIGQRAGGVTGSPKFHRMLAQDWELVGKLRLLNFKRMQDGLYLYRRKK